MRTADGTTYYYMYNGHADVTALLKPDGTIAATYYYDSFGNITDTTGYANNSITFAGYQYDNEIGLYYLNARMYDPKIARFLQEDTYTGDPNDPLSLNLYTYCYNNPLLYDDPTGHKGENALTRLCDWLSGKNKKKEETKAEKKKSGWDWGTEEDAARWELLFDGKTEEFQKAQKEKYEELVDEALIKPVKQIGSIAIGFTPADIVKDSADFIEGKDTFTGESMSRWAMGAMLFLPEVGDQAVRQIAKKKAAKSIAKKAAKNTIEDIIDYTDIAYTTGKVSDIDVNLNLRVAKKTQYTPSIAGKTDVLIKSTGASEVNSINPNKINFSQRTVSKSVNDYAADMKAGNWDWERSGPLRVMERDGNWVSYDNRRLMAAQQVGLDSVPVQVVKPTDVHPEMPGTWEDAFLKRLNHEWNIKAGGPVPNAGISSQPEIFSPKRR